MIDPTKVYKTVLDNIASNLGYDKFDENEASRLAVTRLDANTAFDRFCDWNGLIQWGPQLRNVLDTLREAEIKNGPD